MAKPQCDTPFVFNCGTYIVPKLQCTLFFVEIIFESEKTN